MEEEEIISAVLISSLLVAYYWRFLKYVLETCPPQLSQMKFST